MSYTTLLGYKNGQFVNLIEYRNAWGAAARIWDVLYDNYLKDPNNPVDCWILCKPLTWLWDIAKRTDIPTFERAVHASTFDRAYVRRENFGRFITDLRAFDLKYPCTGNANHFPSWAQDIEKIDADVAAISFHQTSVAENPWIKYEGADEEGEEVYSQYSLSAGFEVYDFIDGKLTESESTDTVDADEHDCNPTIVKETRQTPEPASEASPQTGEVSGVSAVG